MEKRAIGSDGVRSVFTIGALLIALGGGYVAYTNSLARSGATNAPPQQQIDLVAVRTNLLNIGQAERSYLAAHGTFASIEELHREGPPVLPIEHRGYVFSVVVDGARSFKATATPVDPNKPGWPTLVIDETMTITQR